MPCIIKDIFSTQTTGESEKGEDLLKNISKILERNKVELDGYTDAKLVAIANILYWCVDTEHDITHRASEPPTKHKFHRLKVVIEDALTYRSLIEGKSSLPADAYSVNYLKSIYGDERAFYTTQYAAAAVLLLTGVYNRLANSVKINEDFLSKAEQVFDDEMVYRILLIIGNKLRDEKFTNRKKIFLRYGYILFLTLFEKYLYNSFFLGLLFSHIYPLLADIDFHDEACVIIDQICYKFAENDPESLEDRFVYIVNQLARTVKDAVYSQQREIVASTINLIQLVFMRSRNIDEKIVKLGKAQVTFETKELVNIDFDNENPEIFVNIPSLTHSMVHSDFISIDILTKYIEEYSAIPSREKVNINNTSLKDIVKKLINVYSNSNSYKKIFDKNVGRAIYSLLSLSDELSEIYPSNLEAAVSTNFYTQAVSMVSSRAMRFESEFSEQLVHIVKTLISSEDGRVEFHKLPRSVANVVKKVKLFSKPEESLTLCQRVYPNIMCAETWVPPLKSSSAGYRCQNYDNPKKSFEKWVVNLANSLLTSISFDGFYKALPRLFEIESSLAEVLLPHLIYKCLTSYPNTKILGDSHSCITKSQRINTVHAFLSCNINNILNNFMEYDDRVSKLIIDAVEFLVLKKLYRFDTPFDSYKWLDIDYLNLAKAAYSQNMHVSALRFIELSLEDDVLGGSIGKVSEHLNSSTSISLNTSISSSAELNREKMDLLTKIWARINDKTYTMITPPEKDQLSSNETSLSTDSTLNLNLGASDSSLKRLPCDLTMPLSSDDFSVSWHRVITECESRLRSSTFNLDQNTSSVESQLNTDIMEALCRMGRYHTLNVYADGILLRQKLRRDILPLFKVESEGSARFLELMFEGKWRNGDYFKEEKEKLSRNPQFHQLLCKSLDAIRKYDISAFRYLNEENLHRELEKFIDKGSRFSFDQIKNILVLTEFTEIADIIQKHMDAQSYVATEKLFINRDSLSTLLDTWNSRFNVLTTRYKFSDVELIIEARGALLKALADGSKHIKLEPEEYNHVNLRSILFEAIYSLWFDYANLARRACRYDVALHQIPKLKALVCSEVSEVEKDKFLHIQEKLLSVSFENMKIMWDSGTMIPSKQRFQSIRNQVLPLLNFQNDPAGVRRMSSVAAKLISCLGKWAGESQSEDPQTICYDYFDTAISIAHQDKAHKDLDLLYYVYEKYAKFAHEQYNILSMTDPTSEMKTYIDYKLNELKVCEELSNSKDPKFSSELKPKAVYQRLSKKLKLQIDLGNQEIDTYHNKVSMFFSIAVRNYLLSLQVGDDDLDLSAFRLCVLWFSKLHEREVCRMIDKHLNNIPSHKFVPLFYQLAARSVCLEPNDYSLKILQKIIYKTALEHPHHTLYHLIALNNTNEDGNGMKKKFVVHILNALRTQRKSHYSEILTNMEFLTKKLIELMAVDIPSSVLKKTKSFEIDDVSDIRSISNSHIAVPVHKYPVSKSSTYDDIPTLQYFKPRFSVPGGINKPKIVHCMGSDGVEYSLLIKGKDDLRQDSVLMSIFNLVNGLFTQDTESRNKLKIRLYKVVPLAQRAGIVEWIGNTTPIGTYLTEAHAMYNPKDYSPALAHAKMYAEYKKQDSSPEMKLRVFKDVMKHFSPVFRHFFFENYRSAAEWFACRSAYTRSLAATSIAGYIVGLGDRHAHNILIDRSSGELIHVDFGVAFEQGKLLSVPETVPFRLTRDMGMHSTLLSRGTFSCILSNLPFIF